MFTLVSKKIVCGLILFCPYVLMGQNKTFIAPSGGSWNTDSHWSPAGVPTGTDDVWIPAGRTVTGFTSTVSCNNITVSGVMTLGINTGYFVNILGNLSGTGQINFVNNLNTLRIAGNDQFTGMITPTLGTIEYNGSVNQTLVCRSLRSVIFSGNSTKTWSSLGSTSNTFNFLTINSPATFNLSAFT